MRLLVGVLLLQVTVKVKMSKSWLELSICCTSANLHQVK